jgi:NitT/TauT family transport system permease protein
MNAKLNKLSRWLAPWTYLLAILAIAEVVLRVLRVPEYLLPLPTNVAAAACSNTPLISHHLLVTLSEALLGFAAGNSCAIAFGFLFSLWRPVRQGLYPVIVGMQAVPVVAIAPFIQIWFGPGIAGKAIMAALICYFPATVISTNGFSKVNRDGLLFLQSLGATTWQIFGELRFPSAIPSIMSALQVSASLCIVGAVVAELAGANEGVGYLIVRASYEFRTTDLFAILAATSLASYVFFKFIEFIGNIYATKYSFSYAVPTI